MIWSYSENLVILRKIICRFKIFRAFLILRSKRRRERERGGGEGGDKKNGRDALVTQARHFLVLVF